MSDFCDLQCLPVRKNKRLHTTESTVILMKPKNHPNSVLLTAILSKSMQRLKAILRILPTKTAICHVNYAFLPPKTNFSNSAEPLFSGSTYRYFATKPDFASLPSDWTFWLQKNNGQFDSVQPSIFSYRETSQITKIAQNQSHHPETTPNEKRHTRSKINKVFLLFFNFQLIGLPVIHQRNESSHEKEQNELHSQVLELLAKKPVEWQTFEKPQNRRQM